MKRILLILGCILLCAGLMNARRVPGQKVGVKFDTVVFEFGNVIADSSPITHEFKYTVTGESPVAILTANANCGCTTPEYDRKPVTTGESGSIKVSFVPRGQRGEVEKEIRVRLKNGDGASESVTLLLRGVVVPAK